MDNKAQGTRKVLYINPVGTDAWDAPMADYLNASTAPNVELTVRSLKRGPQHLEYHFYEALILVDTLDMIRRAEQEGFDGAVIGCFYDPGLWEAREIVDRMPVTAPCEAACHIAASLGRSFSVIVGRQKWVPRMKENVIGYGFGEYLASFKPVELGVEDFQADPPETNRRLTEAAEEAVVRDGAEVIILGCTLELGFHAKLQKKLGVPVLDAALASLKQVEFLMELNASLNWRTSKRAAYQSPPESEIETWSLAGQYGLISY